MRNELQETDIQILYISDKKDCAMQLFDLRPLNFLIKPLQVERICACVKLAESLIKSAAFIFELKHKNGIYRLDEKDILYFESRNKLVFVHTSQETISVSMHLTEIIHMEPPTPANFIQIHKSFIVNYKFVKHLAYDKVTLKDSAILPISNTFRKHMRQQILALPVALRK